METQQLISKKARSGIQIPFNVIIKQELCQWFWRIKSWFQLLILIFDAVKQYIAESPIDFVNPIFGNYTALFLVAQSRHLTEGK